MESLPGRGDAFVTRPMGGVTVLAQRIHVSGLVQGVGFRPFVWRLARELGVRGWVRNDAQGVELVAQGSLAQLGELARRLHDDAPPLARVDLVRVEAADFFVAKPDNASHLPGFAIVASRPGITNTAIGPDVGVCRDCLRELFDPVDRRWRHAFITCTHCGPRWTVTRALPYDRPQTSLANFTLCPACQAEYTSPADRRFHAETTCCPRCGPDLLLLNLDGKAIEGDPFAQTLALIQAGGIVAVKGLGGFHLVCDARNATAVAALRQRKNREVKPLAVMVANVASLASWVQVSPTEQTLLESRERPIVLLPTKPGCDAALPGVAPGLTRLGVMLPATPMHFLLLHEAAGRPAGVAWLSEPQPLVLVMTSANPGGEPIVRDGVQARQRLAGIADAVLDNNRDIVARCDDSVLFVSGTQTHFIRRSRGYVPAPVRLPRAGPSVLAMGAHMKNTICVTRGDEAFLSPHVGDLNNAATCEYLDETVQRMLNLLGVRPEVIAHGLHAEDASTRAALNLAQKLDVPTLAVEPRHAHLAGVCAEHGCLESVLGLVLEGPVFGGDGTSWCGELLWMNAGQFKRLGCVLDAVADGSDPSCCMSFRPVAPIFTWHKAIQYIAKYDWPAALHDGWTIDSAGCLSLLPALRYLADDGSDAEQVDVCTDHGMQVERAYVAARFYATLLAGLVPWVVQTAQATGLRTVVLGSECFLNNPLLSRLQRALLEEGLRVLVPVHVPAGNAGLALGQAWMAVQHLTTSG